MFAKQGFDRRLGATGLAFAALGLGIGKTMMQACEGQGGVHDFADEVEIRNPAIAVNFDLRLQLV